MEDIKAPRVGRKVCGIHILL